VTVVSFLTSAFFSQPTVTGTTRLTAKHRIQNRFIIEYSLFGEINRCQTSWLVLFAIETIHPRADLFPTLSNNTQIGQGIMTGSRPNNINQGLSDPDQPGIMYHDASEKWRTIGTALSWH
jgi:hypothetical protein